MNLVNIHTHRLEQPCAALQVLSLDATALTGRSAEDCVAYLDAYPTNVLFSVGVHPWKAAQAAPADERMRALLSHPRVLLLGEIGLDKCCDVPFDRQLAVFEQQLQLASEMGKPVILHVVRAMDEVLALKKRYTGVACWVLHAFRGNSQQARQYLQHGFYLSFGLRYRPEALQICPPGRFFLETDDEPQASIEQHYRQVAASLGICIEDLSEHISLEAVLGK